MPANGRWDLILRLKVNRHVKLFCLSFNIIRMIKKEGK